MQQSRFALPLTVRPQTAAPTDGGRLESLRAALLEQCVASGTLARELGELALREAEEIASRTAVPLLVFPVLAEEKLRAVRRWQRRQDHLRRSTDQIAFAA
jgi:hypothetical protein